MPEKYDRLGHGYNATRRADPYLVQRLCHHLRLAPGQAYLDIGCGTGNYTHALHQAGGRMTGVDPSVAMLDQARARYPELTWRQGAAEAIPLPGASVAG
ncbi:MAG: methyltransferase domain-containing protein, partial [Lewinella sp.]|nr:methyltransferase domain-containing protein [Lewinella sp.]